MYGPSFPCDRVGPDYWLLAGAAFFLLGFAGLVYLGLKTSRWWEPVLVKWLDWVTRDRACCEERKRGAGIKVGLLAVVLVGLLGVPNIAAQVETPPSLVYTSTFTIPTGTISFGASSSDGTCDGNSDTKMTLDWATDDPWVAFTNDVSGDLSGYVNRHDGSTGSVSSATGFSSDTFEVATCGVAADQRGRIFVMNLPCGASFGTESPVFTNTGTLLFEFDAADVCDTISTTGIAAGPYVDRCAASPARRSDVRPAMRCRTAGGR